MARKTEGIGVRPTNDDKSKWNARKLFAEVRASKHVTVSSVQLQRCDYDKAKARKGWWVCVCRYLIAHCHTNWVSALPNGRVSVGKMYLEIEWPLFIQTSNTIWLGKCIHFMKLNKSGSMCIIGHSLDVPSGRVSTLQSPKYTKTNNILFQ